MPHGRDRGANRTFNFGLAISVPLALGAIVASCFNPTIPSGVYRCNAGDPDSCPPDMECINGFCTTTAPGTDGGNGGTDSIVIPPDGGMAVCGNGVIEPGEQCEGMDFQGMSCQAMGFLGGSLQCGLNCNINATGCHMCGNGIWNPCIGGEDCDGADLHGQDCTTIGMGFVGGTLGCTMICDYDTTNCMPPVTCPNGILDPGEDCDAMLMPDPLNGGTCASVTMGMFTEGTLLCSAACLYNSSLCYECGNMMVEGSEECDFPDFAGETCITLGFGGGSLACSPTCMFETSLCDPCGNNMIEGMELCDGTNLSGFMDCTDIGYSTVGMLGCSAACDAFTGCAGTCGDGVNEPDEQCDNGAANNDTTPDACRTNCWNPWCGDGVIDTGEQCDGMNIGGATCDPDCGIGLSGTVGCTPTCTFDCTGCT